MDSSDHQTRSVPYRQIRATFDATTIRVYQAYSHAIADAALTGGTFVSPPFTRQRMTWIKPSSATSTTGSWPCTTSPLWPGPSVMP